MLPENYVKTITFSTEDVQNENHICSKIIESTNAKEHWNTLIFLINETELTKLFEEYNINSKQNFEMTEKMFDNFKSNFVTMLKTFYTKKYENSRIGNRPNTINEKNLKGDLERLKGQVFKNASWAIMQEEHHQIQSHQEHHHQLLLEAKKDDSHHSVEKQEKPLLLENRKDDDNQG